MGVVFTHGVAYDTGAFPVGAVKADAELVHIIEGSSLYGLKSVADIREGAGNNHAHSVVDVRFLHQI